jgi:hypothetical protein
MLTGISLAGDVTSIDLSQVQAALEYYYFVSTLDARKVTLKTIKYDAATGNLSYEFTLGTDVLGITNEALLYSSLATAITEAQSRVEDSITDTNAVPAET